MDPRQKEFIDGFVARHGEIVGGATLARLMGYQKVDSLSASIRRKTFPIKTFFVPGRLARHALSVEVAAWLFKLANPSNPSLQNADQGDAMT